MILLLARAARISLHRLGLSITYCTSINLWGLIDCFLKGFLKVKTTCVYFLIFGTFFFDLFFSKLFSRNSLIILTSLGINQFTTTHGLYCFEHGLFKLKNCLWVMQYSTSLFKHLTFDKIRVHISKGIILKAFKTVNFNSSNS